MPDAGKCNSFSGPLTPDEITEVRALLAQTRANKALLQEIIDRRIPQDLMGSAGHMTKMVDPYDAARVPCAGCGHPRSKHRIGCTEVEGAFSYTHGRMCQCLAFVAPAEEQSRG